MFVWVLHPSNTSKVIWWWKPISNSAHTWQLYSAASLGGLAARIMIQYPTHSYYPHPELTSPVPFLFMSSARLDSNMYKFGKSLQPSTWEVSTRVDSATVSHVNIWHSRIDCPLANHIPDSPPAITCYSSFAPHQSPQSPKCANLGCGNRGFPLPTCHLMVEVRSQAVERISLNAFFHRKSLLYCYRVSMLCTIQDIAPHLYCFRVGCARRNTTHFTLTTSNCDQFFGADKVICSDEQSYYQ